MKFQKVIIFPHVISKGHASVKIYKNEPQPGREKPTFTLSYAGPSGRVRRNFAEFDDAEREGKTAVDKLAKGDLEALRLTGRDSQIYASAVDAIRHTGISLDIVAREFAQAFDVLGFDGIIEAARHYKATVVNGLPDITVAECAEQFFETRKAERVSQKFLKDIKRMTEHFSGSFHCQLRAVTPQMFRQYITGMKVGDTTKNNHRRVLVNMFNWAKDQGWLSHDRKTAAEGMKNIDVDDIDPEIYTPAELTAILANSSEVFIPYVALIAFGGLRSDEITDDARKPGQSRGQLRWEDIDFQRGTILVPASISKTGKKRKITMPENLKAWLAPYSNRKGLIFDMVPHHQRRKTCSAVGKMLYGDASQFKWKGNGLRHSFASYRLQLTQNAGQVALEMGNSASIVLKHYADVGVHAEDAAAYFGIYPPKKVEDGKIVTMSPEMPAEVIDEDSRDERELATAAAQ